MRENKKSIEEYRLRRNARLNKRGLGTENRNDAVDTVEAFKNRRDERIKNKYANTVDKKSKKWYNKDEGEGDENWITLHGKNGGAVRVQLNENGEVAKGPKELKGENFSGAESKPLDELEKSKKNGSSGSGKSNGGSTPKNSTSTSGEKPKSKTFQSYFEKAKAKMVSVFPKDEKYSSGVNYEGKTVPLKIQTKEAQEMYNKMQSGQEYTLEELANNETVKYMDDLSEKCTEALGGETQLIDTPERQQLRKEITDQFMAMGAARKIPGENGKKDTYVYDNPVKHEHKAVIYTGLPAAGKSTKVDPMSEEMGAFVFDNDVIKSLIPEFQATGGAAAGAVHEESSDIQKACLKEFLTGGGRNGDNLAIPIIGDNAQKVYDKYIKKLEDAGYDVEVRYQEASPQKSANRVVARAISSGRIINSKVVLGYGEKPAKAFDELKKMVGKNGKPYVRN